jgi:hypothetical protein
MNEFSALRGLLFLVGFTALCWVLFWTVRQARRGGKTMRAAGAMLMLFGWGNLRDPSNNTVAEAREGRLKKGNESGAPPAD